MCAIEGCDSKPHARGWCPMHYQRWRVHGDPGVSLARTGGTLSERFHSFVTIPDTEDCVEWEGSFQSYGYGQFFFENKNRLAHRVSYEIHNGELEKNAVVRHKCDNPPCVNPRHLESGTVADNRRDCVERGRGAFGERGGTAVLTEAQVKAIRGSAGKISQYEMAITYGVAQSTISAVISRRNWSHL